MPIAAPESSKSLNLPDFEAFGTWRWLSLSTPGTGHYYPPSPSPRKCSWYSFLLQAQSAVGSIMSMKNSSNITGNRTRDLTKCLYCVIVCPLKCNVLYFDMLTNGSYFVQGVGRENTPCIWVCKVSLPVMHSTWLRVIILWRFNLKKSNPKFLLRKHLKTDTNWPYKL